MTSPPLDMAIEPRFDGYSCTFHARKRDDILPLIGGEAVSVQASTARLGFQSAFTARDKDDRLLALIYTDHTKHEGLCRIEAKGVTCVPIVDRIRDAYPVHKVTRADACIDLEGEGLFDAIFGTMLEIKTQSGMYGEARGDWHDPDAGRTYMLGSKESASRVRFYEKGKQPIMAHHGRPQWVRLEVEVHPPKKADGLRAATMAPVEFFGAARFSQQLYERVLVEHVDRVKWANLEAEPNFERALRHCLKQYARIYREAASRLPGGFDDLGRYIEAGIEAAQRRAPLPPFKAPFGRQ